MYSIRRPAHIGIILVFVIFAFIFAPRMVLPNTAAQTEEGLMLASYQELFDISQNETRGLTFYIKGQTIPALVVQVIGDEAVEVRNQVHDRIIIRIDSIDAIALN